MVEIKPRSAWGARPWVCRSYLSLPTFYVDVHHAGVPSRGALGVRQSQNFHLDSKGWCDIFYNFLVDHDGTIWTGRGAGVVSGSNSHNIQVMGNFDVAHPSTAQINSLVELLRLGIQRGWWRNNIRGHLDRASTGCPGRNLYPRLPEIRQRVSATTPPPVTRDWFDMATEADLDRVVQRVLDRHNINGRVGLKTSEALDKLMPGLLHEYFTSTAGQVALSNWLINAINSDNPTIQKLVK